MLRTPRLTARGIAISALLGLGTSALAGCVSTPKKDKAKTEAKAAKNLVVDALPEDAKKLEVNFDNKLSLIGYKLETKGDIKPGDKVKYTLYWKVEKPLEDKGYRLFTHVFDGTKKRLLNIDKVGDLRTSDLIPSAWQAGKIYQDEQLLTVPKNAAGNKLQVVTGFFKDNSRLKIVKGPQLGADGALALTIPLKGGAPTPAWRPQTLRVDRLDKGTTITIDGKLTEAAWDSAPKTGAFINVGTGKVDPTQPVQGSARLLWDAKSLYVAFEVTDKDIIGGFDKGAKDPHLWTKDTVEIMVDPDGDGDNKDYYEIQVSPQNLVFDSRFDTYNLPKGGPEGPFGNQDWSAKLKSAVVVDGTLDKTGDEDKGYVVEIAIPWTSFDKVKRTPPELGDTWRLNFYAMQNNGGVGWSPILGKGNFHKASQFGRILFAEKGWNPPPPPAPPAPGGPAVGSPTIGTATSVSPTAGAPSVGVKPAPAAPGAPKLVAPGAAPTAAKPAAPKPVAPKP
jgi:hypothetical protein